MTTVVFVIVGCFLGLFGALLTAFAVGERKSFSKTSENYSSLGRMVRFSLLLLSVLAATLLCMSFLISSWYLFAFVPSIAIGLSIKSETREEQLEAAKLTTVSTHADIKQPEVGHLSWSPEIVRGGELRDANLAGLDLHGANLFMADLGGANLMGADLSGAFLIGANLTAAKLNNCFLREAYLTR